jgi:uncharacterized protein (DUF2461 family)
MVGIMPGCYSPSREQLSSIRQAIKNDTHAFRALIDASSFKDRFGDLQGEALKRSPPEWQNTATVEPLIRNKQFYFALEKERELIVSDNLIDEIMACWQAARPIHHDFLSRSMDTP